MEQTVCLSQSLTRGRTAEDVAELWKEGFRVCALYNSSAF